MTKIKPIKKEQVIELGSCLQNAQRCIIFVGDTQYQFTDQWCPMCSTIAVQDAHFILASEVLLTLNTTIYHNQSLFYLLIVLCTENRLLKINFTSTSTKSTEQQRMCVVQGDYNEYPHRIFFNFVDHLRLCLKMWYFSRNLFSSLWWSGKKFTSNVPII